MDAVDLPDWSQPSTSLSTSSDEDVPMLKGNSPPAYYRLTGRPHTCRYVKQEALDHYKAANAAWRAANPVEAARRAAVLRRETPPQPKQRPMSTRNRASPRPASSKAANAARRAAVLRRGSAACRSSSGVKPPLPKQPAPSKPTMFSPTLRMPPAPAPPSSPIGPPAPEARPPLGPRLVPARFRPQLPPRPRVLRPRFAKEAPPPPPPMSRSPRPRVLRPRFAKEAPPPPLPGDSGHRVHTCG